MPPGVPSIVEVKLLWCQSSAILDVDLCKKWAFAPLSRSKSPGSSTELGADSRASMCASTLPSRHLPRADMNPSLAACRASEFVPLGGVASIVEVKLLWCQSSAALDVETSRKRCFASIILCLSLRPLAKPGLRFPSNRSSSLCRVEDSRQMDPLSLHWWHWTSARRASHREW